MNLLLFAESQEIKCYLNFCNYLFGLFVFYLYLCISFKLSYKATMKAVIKRNIKKYGYTSAVIAEKIGVTAQAFSQIVNGNPTLSKLCEIAEAMSISVSELLNDEAATPTHPDGCVCPVCGARLRLIADEAEASNVTESK